MIIHEAVGASDSRVRKIDSRRVPEGQAGTGTWSCRDKGEGTRVQGEEGGQQASIRGAGTWSCRDKGEDIGEQGEEDGQQASIRGAGTWSCRDKGGSIGAGFRMQGWGRRGGGGTSVNMCVCLSVCV